VEGTGCSFVADTDSVNPVSSSLRASSSEGDNVLEVNGMVLTGTVSVVVFLVCMVVSKSDGVAIVYLLKIKRTLRL
jgi:hypothetical protein